MSKRVMGRVRTVGLVSLMAFAGVCAPAGAGDTEVVRPLSDKDGKSSPEEEAQRLVQAHCALAEQYLREDRLQDAAEEYKEAIRVGRRDPELYVKAGDVIRLLTRTDPLMVDKDKQFWLMALEVDPKYLPAMQRLLDSYLEDAQLWPIPKTFERVRDICDRILAVDPADTRAKANLHMYWLQRWMAGVETPPQQVDESMRELVTLQQKDPSNIDIPFILAKAKVAQARALAAQNRQDEAVARVGEAEAIMRQCVEANPDHPRALLRQGQVFVEAASSFSKDPARRKAYRATAIAVMARARELVKVEDPAYAEVSTAAATVHAQELQNDKAEAIYREVLQRRPEDRDVRIALARLLAADPARRQEAINLLEENIADDPSLIGARVRLRFDRQLRVQAVLAGLRIDALAATKDEIQKAGLQVKIDGHLKAIYNAQGESPEYLRLKGRLYQARDQFVEAIQTYRRAATRSAELGLPQNDDMMYQLARVYIAAQQTGEARRILEDLVSKYDAFIPARVLLCRALMAEGDWDRLEPHLRYLEQAAPNDPQVISLRQAASSRQTPAAALGGNATTRQAVPGEQRAANPSDGDQVFDEFAREIASSRAADAQGRADEALQHLQKAEQIRPDALEVWDQCFQFYARHRQWDKLQPYLAKLMAVNQDRAGGRLYQFRLAMAKGEVDEAIGIARELTLKLPEFAQSWLALGQGLQVGRRYEEAKAAYLRSLEMRSADVDAYRGLVETCYALRQYDEAEAALTRLAEKVPDRPEPALMLADFHARTNHPNSAELVLRQAMQKMPQATELWQRLAGIQVGANRSSDALRTLDEAPDQDKVLTQKVEILLQTQSVARAKELVTDAIARKGENFALINAQGDIALLELDFAAARQLADRSLVLKPDNPRALRHRALTKMLGRPADLEGAIADLGKAIGYDPRDPELRVVAADAYLGHGDRDSAIRSLEAVAALLPRDAKTWHRLMDLYLGSNPPRVEDARALVEQVRASGGNTLELTMRAAQIAQMRKDSATAIAEMRRAVNMADGKADVVQAYMTMLLDLGQYDMLLKESNQLIDQNPDAWWIRSIRASALARKGQKDQAFSEWELALSLAEKAKDDSGALTIVRAAADGVGHARIMPRVLERAAQEPRWMFMAAWLYHSAGDWSNAVSAVDKGMALLDSLPADEQQRAMAVAGAVYLSCQPAMADKALAIYQKLLVRDPGDVQTLNNLACLYIDYINPPEPAKALEYSQRAYDQMRRRGEVMPMLMDTHGWVLANNGRAEEGIALLQDVVQRQPLLEARVHLARALVMDNRMDAARHQAVEARAQVAAMEKQGIPVDPALRTEVERLLARLQATTAPTQSRTTP